VQASLALTGGAELPERAALDGAVAGLRRQFDAANGGFGGAPKFPRSDAAALLLRYHRRTGDAGALDMTTRTLEAMAAGGIPRPDRRRLPTVTRPMRAGRCRTSRRCSTTTP
jgi:uncharacterized protein YyaL (SSP411 family)